MRILCLSQSFASKLDMKAYRLQWQIEERGKIKLLRLDVMRWKVKIHTKNVKSFTYINICWFYGSFVRLQDICSTPGFCLFLYDGKRQMEEIPSRENPQLSSRVMVARAAKVISHLIAFHWIPCRAIWVAHKMQFPKNSRSRFSRVIFLVSLGRLFVNYAESFIVEAVIQFRAINKFSRAWGK